ALTLSMNADKISAKDIAGRLNVDHYIEGSVRQDGSRVRVAVQLINAHDGFHRWSRTYDREFTDILGIEEDIARAVAAELRVKLLDSDESRLRSRGTRDAEAYRLLLIANELGDSDRALQLYHEVLARDPNFAAAHAALAMLHFYRAWLSMDEPDRNEQLGRAER